MNYVGFVAILLTAMAAAWIMYVQRRGRRFLESLREATLSFDGTVLQFEHYPFEPATVYPAGPVRAADIQDIELGHCSEIRLKNGDILFVPYSSKAALVEFVNYHEVKLTKRISVWAFLLAPFLDSTQSNEEIDSDLKWLEERGIDEASVRKWRREIGRSMIALNFGTGLWEWTGFGMYDVLVAKRAFGKRSSFDDFYRRAIVLAALDAPYPVSSTMDWRDSMTGALHAVLLDWFPPMEKGSISTFSERWQVRSEKVENFRTRLFGELSAAYSDPAHIARIDNYLSELRNQYERAIRLNEVKWALIFFGACGDDVQSAAWACSVMQELGRPLMEQEYVRALIMQEQNFSPDVELVHGLARVRVSR